MNTRLCPESEIENQVAARRTTPIISTATTTVIKKTPLTNISTNTKTTDEKSSRSDNKNGILKLNPKLYNKATNDRMMENQTTRMTQFVNNTMVESSHKKTQVMCRESEIQNQTIRTHHTKETKVTNSTNNSVNKITSSSSSSSSSQSQQHCRKNGMKMNLNLCQGTDTEDQIVDTTHIANDSLQTKTNSSSSCPPSSPPQQQQQQQSQSQRKARIKMNLKLCQEVQVIDHTSDPQSINNTNTNLNSSITSTTSTSTTASSTLNNRQWSRRNKSNEQLPIHHPVKCVRKQQRTSDFNPLLLISTMTKIHEGPIWCLEFSKDGRYFATAGSDGVLQIWNVSPTLQEQTLSESGDESSSIDESSGNDLSNSVDWNNNSSNHHTPIPCCSSVDNDDETNAEEIKILSPHPCQKLIPNSTTSPDIVDLSWSHTNFLLSASLDKTVRLWHPSKSYSLGKFHHSDVVTTVSFDPTDDRYFVSGGFDKKIQIWSIPIPK